MTAHVTTGRIAVASTVNHVVRRQINQYAGAIAERVVAAALKGDPGGLQAAVALLIAVNGPEAHGNPAPRVSRTEPG